MDKEQLAQALAEVLPQVLQEQFNIDLTAVPSTLEQINSLTAAQADKMWRDTIQLDGDEYDTAVTAVKEYYEKLPQETQQALDNPEGLKYIWSQVQPNLAAIQEQANQLTPAVDEGSPTTTSSPQVNYSPTRIWSEAEIDEVVNSGGMDDPKIAQVIEQAYTEGRVQ